tara:strand:+ start:185 stop:640 length:456 start_codon:yes stop_codon:yes gene_type:complete
MSSLNINDLYETINERNIKRYGKFDDILKCIHNRIKSYAKNEQTCCFYKIPEFIIGVPLYNIKDLTNYLFNSLKKNGFQLMYIDPNVLFISWEKKSKPITSNDLKKKDKPKSSEFKLIDEYKPNGEFIYNQIDLNSMKDKSKDLLNKNILL